MFIRCLLLSSLIALTSAALAKPNIILIYADDISARELPLYGSSKWSGFRGSSVSDKKYLAETPVLDRIAKEGAWVSNAWAATICSPSRAMMMTGRYASIHKWWHNSDYGSVVDPKASLKKKKSKKSKKRKGPVVPLYVSSPTQIGHLAQQAGYATMWTGKTQMKGSDSDLQNYGFDEGVYTPGSLSGALDKKSTTFILTDQKSSSEKTFKNIDSGKLIVGRGYTQVSWYWQPSVLLMNHPKASKPMEYWPNTRASKKNFGVETYGPDVELDFIFDFIDRKHKEKKPFFVYHTTHLGHDAFDWLIPESEDKWPGTPIVNWTGKKYKRVKTKITGSKGKYNTHGTVTEPGIASHVKYLDYQMWLYLEKLKKLKIEDETIIIFTADNGTSGYGKGSHDRQRGVHVPFIIYAPGQKMTKKGQQDILVSIADILPTLADLMGTSLPEDYVVHGESMWPYLTTDKADHRPWIYSHKSDRQMIRGHKVLKDGSGVWWDVEETPADLTSFKRINDWSKVSKAHQDERDMLNKVLPQYDNYHTAHDYIVPSSAQ